MSGCCAPAASAKITRAPATANRGSRATGRTLWSKNMRRDLRSMERGRQCAPALYCLAAYSESGKGMAAGGSAHSAGGAYSYAGSASARAGRPLSPTRLHKRYAISSPCSSFVVVPGGDHELLVAEGDDRVDLHSSARRDVAGRHRDHGEQCGYGCEIERIGGADAVEQRDQEAR